MSKKNKQSFRQRLRADCLGELSKLVERVNDAAGEICEEKGISGNDLMKLASSPNAKTLCDDLVTQLANQRELELEALYNKQIDLIPEEKTDGKS